MNKYTADDFLKRPAIIYREADRNGLVQIKHSRYPDKVFVLTSISVKAMDADNIIDEDSLGFTLNITALNKTPIQALDIFIDAGVPLNAFVAQEDNNFRALWHPKKQITYDLFYPGITFYSMVEFVNYALNQPKESS